MILLSAQLAMSVLLVYYTLSFNSTFSKLKNIPSGFNPENLHIYTLLAKPSTGNSVPENYFRNLLYNLRQLPGVEAASITFGRPPADFPSEYKHTIKTVDGRDIQATVVSVSPDYFHSLELPLISGRDFSWHDRDVMIINDKLRRKISSSADLLNRTITFGNPGNLYRVIGVADNMAYFGPQWGNSTIAFVSCNKELNAFQSGAVILVRSKRNIEEIRNSLQSLLNPAGIYYIARSVEQKELWTNSVKQERMLACFASALGVLVILLAGVELYAFCNYLMILRTKELAIRTSIGADACRITTALLSEIITALVIGLTVGGILVLTANGVIAHLIGALNPLKFFSLMMALVIVTGAALCSILSPTLRAIRANPADALRVD